LAREVVVVDPAEADEPPPPQAAKTTVARAATMNPKRVIQRDVRRGSTPILRQGSGKLQEADAG